MRNILISPSSNGAHFMYLKANTKHQKALLGYMIKNGVASDPILGGAFNLLCEIEACELKSMIYILNIACDPDVATEIGKIAERAKMGAYNKYAFSNWELAKILTQIEA